MAKEYGKLVLLLILSCFLTKSNSSTLTTKKQHHFKLPMTSLVFFYFWCIIFPFWLCKRKFKTNTKSLIALFNFNYPSFEVKICPQTEWNELNNNQTRSRPFTIVFFLFYFIYLSRVLIELKINFPTNTLSTFFFICMVEKCMNFPLCFSLKI